MCIWFRSVVGHVNSGKNCKCGCSSVKSSCKKMNHMSPQISSSREDRALPRISNQNRTLTSTLLKREWQDTSGVVNSARTVRRRLDEAGLYGRVARKKPLLTEQHE